MRKVSPAEIRELRELGSPLFIDYIKSNVNEMIAEQDMAMLTLKSHEEFNRLRRLMGLPEIRPEEHKEHKEHKE